jgi:uncharacterized protein (DUF433 family)
MIAGVFRAYCVYRSLYNRFNQQPKEQDMIALPETVALPLKMDEHGTIRVSDTRVTLDTVIACYHQGDSPEAIHEGFDVLPLDDIYTVIAYYLAHRVELDAYLRRGREEAERLRQEWEASYTPTQKLFNERIGKLAEEKRRNRNEFIQWHLPPRLHF